MGPDAGWGLGSGLGRAAPDPSGATVTEQLDATLGAHWHALDTLSPAPRYVAAWRQSGTPAQRLEKLYVYVV